MKNLKKHADVKIKRREKLKNVPKPEPLKKMNFQPLIEKVKQIIEKINENDYSDNNIEQEIFKTAIECIYPSDKIWIWWNSEHPINIEKSISNKKDQTNTKCQCGGTYKEREFHDDMDGILRCGRCGKVIKRWA